MARVRFNRRINIGRVVKRLVATVISLWVGGTIMIELGNVMNCSESPFYRGLTLIGWTVQSSYVPDTGGLCNSTALLFTGTTTGTHYNLITGVSGTGVLAVVGIIGIAGVVMEFVNIGY